MLTIAEINITVNSVTDLRVFFGNYENQLTDTPI